MFNMNNKKTRQRVSAVLALLLVLAMVVPMVLEYVM